VMTTIYFVVFVVYKRHFLEKLLYIQRVFVCLFVLFCACLCVWGGTGGLDIKYLLCINVYSLRNCLAQVKQILYVQASTLLTLPKKAKKTPIIAGCIEVSQWAYTHTKQNKTNNKQTNTINSLVCRSFSINIYLYATNYTSKEYLFVCLFCFVRVCVCRGGLEDWI
jgi:hypothetical protein